MQQRPGGNKTEQNKEVLSKKIIMARMFEFSFIKSHYDIKIS